MRLEDFGKLPLYIEKIFKKKETVRQKEVERIQAINLPMRHLPKEERYVLLTVSGLKYYYLFTLEVILLR